MGGRQSQHAPRPLDDIPFTKESRVAIIGAGPAGVHMAHLLKQRGYTKVTLIEQGPEVGGKSVTKFLKETGDNVPHEMGTVFLHPGYHRVLALAKEYGIPVVAHDTNKKCDIWAPKFQESRGQPKDQPLTLMGFMFSNVRAAVHPQRGWQWLPKEMEMLTILVAIIKYIRLHREIFGKFEYTLPPCPSDEHLDMMNMTFSQFLDANNLQPLIPLLALGHTAQGYGFLNTIPAFYGLWWNSPDFLFGLVKFQSLAQLLKPGYQTLWKTVVTQDKLDIMLNTRVNSINRNLDQQDKPIEIEVTTDGKTQTLEFDFLVSTLIMPGGLNLFQDATPDEKEVFSALKSSNLITTIYQAKTFRDNERGIQFYPERQTPEYEGRFYSERISEKALYNNIPKADTHVAVAYQYISEYRRGEEQTTREIVQKDLEEIGYTDVKILEHKSFEYFPKFSKEDVKKKYPWKILEFQGKNRTWFAGSSTCFESAEDVICYNHLLLRIFNMEKMPATAPPPPPPCN